MFSQTARPAAVIAAILQPLRAGLTGLHPRNLLRRIGLAAALRRQRGDLLALDDTRLRDIGLTREQVDAEARLPCWDVPRHWLR